MSDEQERTLFVGNIHADATEAILYELFLQAGPIERISQPKDRETGKRKNFAFMVFSHAASVAYAIHLINGIKLFDQSLRCQNRNSKDVASYSTVGVHSIECEDVLQRCLDGSIEEEPEKEEANYYRRRSGSNGYQGGGKKFTPKPLDANQTWRNNLVHHDRQHIHTNHSLVSNVMMGHGSLAAMSPNNSTNSSKSSQSRTNAYANLAKSASHYHNMNTQILSGSSGFDLRSTLSGGQPHVGQGDGYRSTKDDRYSSPSNSYHQYQRHSGNSHYNNSSINDSYNSYGSYNANSSGYGSHSSNNSSAYESSNYGYDYTGSTRNNNRQHQNNRDRSGSYGNEGSYRRY